MPLPQKPLARIVAAAMNWNWPVAMLTLLVAGAPTARGDSTIDTSQPADPATYDAFSAPRAMTDPQATPEQQAAQQQLQARAQADQAWFQRSYSQQAGARNDASDRYSAIANNPDLAKIAGLPTPDTITAKPEAAAPDHSSAATDESSLRLLKDAPASTDHASLFRPLISSMSAADPTSIGTLSPPDAAPPAPTPAQTQAADNSAMDVPGLTAAEKGLPPGEDLKLALTPDQGALPQEMSFKSDPAKFSLKALPLSGTTDDLLKAQQSLMLPPVAPGSVAPEAPKRPAPVADDEDKMIAPASSGLRSQIADPRDYTFR